MTFTTPVATIRGKKNVEEKHLVPLLLAVTGVACSRYHQGEVGVPYHLAAFPRAVTIGKTGVPGFLRITVTVDMYDHRAAGGEWVANFLCEIRGDTFVFSEQES